MMYQQPRHTPMACFFPSHCVNICTFPQKLNLTHVMQEQKCFFSGRRKQTDVYSICQQVIWKLLLLQDTINHTTLLTRLLVFCRKDNSILWDVSPVVWKIQDSGFIIDPWRSSRQPLCSIRVRLLRSTPTGALIISKGGDSTLSG